MSHDGRTFSVVREIARKELDRHQRRFLGITTTVPTYINEGDTETAAHMEWVVDVRIDVRQFGGKNFESFDGTDSVLEPKWGLLKNVIISHWAVGAIADMNIPVLMERNESGQISIIARSNMRLPDIVYKTYSYNDLGFLFMKNLIYDVDGTVGGVAGTYVDAFGHIPEESPLSETGVSRTYRWSNDIHQWGSQDFLWASSTFNENDPEWVEEIGE